MAAAVILAAFVLVGLLDSVHYRPQLPAQDGKVAYATEVRSLLDRVVEPLRVKREKTYSAPLATHLYAKETLQTADGREVREYPRLRHGGAHLKNPELERTGDIALRAFRGLALALLLWFTLAVGLSAAVAQRAGIGIETAWGDIWRGRTPVPWRAVLCALAVLVVLVGPMAALAMSPSSSPKNSAVTTVLSA
jgi:peptide/nickel transport system permease protein